MCGFWLTETPLIGHCVPQINRYVCDWLKCSMLQKHINTNLWCSPGCKHAYALESTVRQLQSTFVLLFVCFVIKVSFSLNHPGDPCFYVLWPTQGSQPRVWKPLAHPTFKLKGREFDYCLVSNQMKFVILIMWMSVDIQMFLLPLKHNMLFAGFTLYIHF